MVRKRNDEANKWKEEKQKQSKKMVFLREDKEKKIKMWPDFCL